MTRIVKAESECTYVLYTFDKHRDRFQKTSVVELLDISWVGLRAMRWRKENIFSKPLFANGRLLFESSIYDILFRVDVRGLDFRCGSILVINFKGREDPGRG